MKHTTAIYASLRITLTSPLIMTPQPQVNVRASASVWIIMFSWFNLLPNMNAILKKILNLYFHNLRTNTIKVSNSASNWYPIVSFILENIYQHVFNRLQALIGLILNTTQHMPMLASLLYIPCNHLIFAVSPYNFITSTMSTVLNYNTSSMMVNSSAIE